MAVHCAVRLHVGHRRKVAVYEIGEKIGDVPHVIRNHTWIIRLILEWVADIAIAPIERARRSIGIEAAAIMFPGNIVGAEHIADAPLRGLWNDETALRQSLRSEGRVDVDGFHRIFSYLSCPPG
jgi:hypothetical protein